jgi:hypothetical protein
MKALKKCWLAILLIGWFIQEVNGQVAPNTFSLGITADYYYNQDRGDAIYQKHISLKPDLHYFYKENRALVGGILFSQSEFNYQTSSDYYGRQALYKVSSQGVGGYIGIRNLYSITEKFYLYTDFGLLYTRFNNKEELVEENQPTSYNHDYHRHSFSLRAYAGLGLMYFMSQKFSLEVNLLNGGITYGSPLGEEGAKIHDWNVDMKGGIDDLSFGLRYYF